MKRIIASSALLLLILIPSIIHVSRVGAQSVSSSPPAPIPQARPAFLDLVASIVEADIVSVAYSYDDTDGPRTVYTLSNVVVRQGPAPDSPSFTQFGGPLPDGRYAGASDLPVLTPGSRYILFMMGGPWFLTPVWDNMAFRIETIGSRAIVIAPDGRPVHHIGIDGVVSGATQVVDYSQKREPNVPISASAKLDASSQDLQTALDSSAFLDAARLAIGQIGGLSPLPLSFRAAHTGPWNVFPTAPPKAGL